MYNIYVRACIGIIILLCVEWQIHGAEQTYNPLTHPSLPIIDVSIHAEQGEHTVPVRIYMPEQHTAAAVVIFCHGLGGSRASCSYLGQHWARRGYVVVATQHVGSDESVWKGKSVARQMAAMKQAASPRNFLLRVQDIHMVLDQLELWNADKDSPLYARLDLERIGMSGHSFGALTTQAVSGQKFPMGNIDNEAMMDARIQAAIMLSPSSPQRGRAQQAFGEVKIPWMLMTGTQDTVRFAHIDMKSRLAVFPALPVGNKYELVLHGAQHSAFTERVFPGDSKKRNPNHHQAILALSTAFWDSHLKKDSQAQQWLHGEGARSVLERKDTWQKK